MPLENFSDTICCSTASDEAINTASFREKYIAGRELAFAKKDRTTIIISAQNKKHLNQLEDTVDTSLYSNLIGDPFSIQPIRSALYYTGTQFDDFKNKHPEKIDALQLKTITYDTTKQIATLTLLIIKNHKVLGELHAEYNHRLTQIEMRCVIYPTVFTRLGRFFSALFAPYRNHPWQTAATCLFFAVFLAGLIAATIFGILPMAGILMPAQWIAPVAIVGAFLVGVTVGPQLFWLWNVLTKLIEAKSPFWRKGQASNLLSALFVSSIVFSPILVGIAAGIIFGILPAAGVAIPFSWIIPVSMIGAGIVGAGVGFALTAVWNILIKLADAIAIWRKTGKTSEKYSKLSDEDHRLQKVDITEKNTAPNTLDIPYRKITQNIEKQEIENKETTIINIPEKSQSIEEHKEETNPTTEIAETENEIDDEEDAKTDEFVDIEDANENGKERRKSTVHRNSIVKIKPESANDPQFNLTQNRQNSEPPKLTLVGSEQTKHETINPTPTKEDKLIFSTLESKQTFFKFDVIDEHVKALQTFLMSQQDSYKNMQENALFLQKLISGKHFDKEENYVVENPDNQNKKRFSAKEFLIKIQSFYEQLPQNPFSISSSFTGQNYKECMGLMFDTKGSQDQDGSTNKNTLSQAYIVQQFKILATLTYYSTATAKFLFKTAKSHKQDVIDILAAPVIQLVEWQKMLENQKVELKKIQPINKDDALLEIEKNINTLLEITNNLFGAIRKNWGTGLITEYNNDKFKSHFGNIKNGLSIVKEEIHVNSIERIEQFFVIEDKQNSTSENTMK